MRKVEIPKGNGKSRIVYAPSQEEQNQLSQLLPRLAATERRAALAAGTTNVVRGFVRGENPITCAKVHIGFCATITTDLKSWFDSVRPEQIAAGLEIGGTDPSTALQLARRLCYLNAPRQGLCTSPCAANLAAIVLDRRILNALRPLPWRTVYTRYADDLTISVDTDDRDVLDLVFAALESAVASMDWEIAPAKTHRYRAAAGNRTIVGVSVGDRYVCATRASRRKLRAAQHRANQVNATRREKARARGIGEWCLCRVPKSQRPTRAVVGADPERRPARPVTTAQVSTVTVGCGTRRVVYCGTPVT